MMKRSHLILAALCGTIFTFVSGTSAQTLRPSTSAKAQPPAEIADVKTDSTANIVSDGSNSEFETLRRRLEEVERQNRALGRTLIGYFANRITPGGNLLFGADYLYWLTDYKGLQRGVDHRVNIFLQYNF